MEPEMHPAIRRITWLIIAIGAITILTAVVMPLLNVRTPLDGSSTFILGLLWLVVGALLMRWLRPTPRVPTAGENVEDSLIQLNMRLDTMERTLQSIQAKINEPSNVRLDSLDYELDSLATTVQDAHKKLDDLGDVTSRLRELETQLDSLYVTLHDTHKRIDDMEQAGKR